MLFLARISSLRVRDGDIEFEDTDKKRYSMPRVGSLVFRVRDGDIEFEDIKV